VYGSEDFPKIGLPTADRSDQPPDLVLAAKPDYGFSGAGRELGHLRERRHTRLLEHRSQNAGYLYCLGLRYWRKGRASVAFPIWMWLRR
jgi:hypothetical protein